MFRTLNDLKPKDKNEDPKKKKTTDSYAGGEKSGIAIENPNDIMGIIEKAEKNPSSEKGSDGREETQCKITLYQNGFVVDDGPFREYSSPENKLFMKELNDQRVPTELRSKYPKGLSVSLDDKTKEAYRPPTPPSYVAFSGQGTSFGGVSVGEPLQVNLQNGQIPVDESKPTTNIQFRLHNGKTVKIRVNVSTTVHTLYDYVTSVAPIDGSFELISGFPPQPLKDYNKTVEQADLLDSRVTQKITG